MEEIDLVFMKAEEVDAEVTRAIKGERDLGDAKDISITHTEQIGFKAGSEKPANGITNTQV